MAVEYVEVTALSQQEQEQKSIDDAAAAAQAIEDAKAGPSEEEKAAAEKEKARLAAETQNKEIELSDDKVLSHINKQRGTSYASMDEAFTVPAPEKVKLSESVAAFQKYEQETGRGINDYFHANRDRTNDDDDIVLREYIKEKNPNFNSDDITFSLNQEYGFNEDTEEDEKRIKGLNKKQKISEARSHFSQQNEQYKGPLESSTTFVPKEEQESYSAWKTQQEQAGANQQANQEVSARFQSDTDSVFSNNFEGFNFNVGEDQVVTYKIEDVTKVKDQQSNARNFIDKHIDEKGSLKDPVAYHKAMLIASDPDGFAKFFMEQGASTAIEKQIKDSKNINMTRIADGTMKINKETKVTSVNGNGRSTVRIPLPKNQQE